MDHTVKHFRQLFVVETINLTLVLTFRLHATYRKCLESVSVGSGRSSVCCPQLASLLCKKTLSFSFPFFFMQGLCDVTPEGYHHLTKLLMNLANGKVVVALEVKQFTTL